MGRTQLQNLRRHRQQRLQIKRTGLAIADERRCPRLAGFDAVTELAGKDTAAGKTFEIWVKRYWEKKAAGEQNIQIEPETLDE